ncbi:MAG: hypothetical protein WKF49_07515 [Thermoleophilaceae bacterium]
MGTGSASAMLHGLALSPPEHPALRGRQRGEGQDALDLLLTGLAHDEAAVGGPEQEAELELDEGEE